MTINRRSFIASTVTAIAAHETVTADVVKFHPLLSAVVEPPEEPVRPTFLIRPLGQIAHIVQNGSYEWDADLERELLNRGLRYGPEATSMVFQITLAEARKRWGSVADYVTGNSITFPGWLFVHTESDKPLRLWKDGEFHLSWVSPGAKSAAFLKSWYDRRIDYATTAGPDGREVISSELTPGGAKEVATAATPFPPSEKTTGQHVVLFGRKQRGKSAETSKRLCPPGKT